MRLSAVGPVESHEGLEDSWFGSNRLRTCKNGEVVWTMGSGKIRRRFARTYSGVREPQSLFTVFENELCACTLVGDTIQVNSESGAEWDVSLPFRGRKLWANPVGGILVERWLPLVKKDIADDEPLIFSISHPLDEAKPVDLDRDSELVWVLEGAPLLITFSRKDASHTLWTVKRNNRAKDVDVMDIRSELCLTAIRTFPREDWGHKLSKAFLAHTERMELVLCAVISECNSLFGSALDGSEKLDFQVLDVADAVSVMHSTEDGARDIVVLAKDRTLQLYRGPMHLCPLVVAHLLPAQTEIAKLPRNASSDCALDLVLSNASRVTVLIRARSKGTSPPCFVIVQAARTASPVLGLALSVDLALRSEDFLDDFDALVSLLSEIFAPPAKGSTLDLPISPFEMLIASEYHLTYDGNDIFSSLPDAQTRTDKRTTTSNSMRPLLSRSVLQDLAPRVLVDFFLAGHLGYEDMKLNVLQYHHLRKVAGCLGGLCRRLFASDIASAYDDFYLRDLGSVYAPVPLGQADQDASPATDRVNSSPADIMESLYSSVQGTTLQATITPWLGMASKVLRVFTSLREHGDLRAAKEMVDCGIDMERIAAFPMGIQMVFREILHRCRESPPAYLTREMAVLIGRDDVYLSATNQGSRGIRPASQELLAASASMLGDRTSSAADDGDDYAVLQNVTRLRFGRDRRVKEAFKLLDSAASPLLVVKRRPEMTDHDLIKAQQIKLKQLIFKSMAGTIGRGALLLFTKRNVYEKTIKVPELAKAGKVPPQNVEVQLDETHQVESSWPAFHNGVGAGLAGVQRDAISSATKDLTRSWILFNKAKPPTDAHAGVLLALGLNKDLACLTMADTYEHIEPGHELTSVAILLGLGCAKAGSCDANVRKTLTLHIPSLFPQEFSDLDVVPCTVQSAALAGMGMLYRGTCNRLMCEFFLEEMIKSPSSDAVVEQRASYSLSAGLALGLVALGFGGIEGGLAGLADLEIEDRLYVLISGGPVTKFAHQVHAYVDDEETGGLDSRSKVAPVAARQGSTAGTGDHRMGGASGVTGSSADREPKCSRVLEGTHVNTDVTCPGAAMALGLIYLKSNDISTASRLAPPSTRFLLENVRPDFLLFRVWARSLVMWDSVLPDLSWILDQIPPYLRSMQSSDLQDAKFLAQSRAYIAAGAALGIGCRFSGTMSRLARDALLQLFHMGEPDETAMMIDEEKEQFNKRPLFADVDPTCADACFAVVAIALGLVMAGSGDLTTLRTLRSFRKHTKRYGSQQLAGMSVGFLFLGAGRMSFSRTNEAIAAIVCSVFPVLAESPGDNSEYLQALRHLYVLAAEPRSVEAFDSDTGEPCYVPLIIKLNSDLTLGEISCPQELEDVMAPRAAEEKERPVAEASSRFIRVVAPAVMPPLEYIESITVDSSRYWPLSVVPSRLPLQLIIKLRGDQLPYHIDPRGLSCLSARPRPKLGEELLGSLREFASKSPYLLAYAKFAPNHFDIIYDCLVQDSVDALPVILEVASFRAETGDLLQAQQLRFLKQYYRLSLTSRERLVPERMLSIDVRIDRGLLRTYVKEGLRGVDSMFLSAMNVVGIPKRGKLSQLNLSHVEGLQQAAKIIDADALLEICDACL